MVLLMWTQQNILIETGRATFAAIFDEKLCPKQGCPFCFAKNMNFLDTISLSNSGMASAGELISFFGVIALMILDEIISNKK